MSYSDRILSLSPVAYYRLNELTGTVMLDSSGHARHGTYVGGPLLAQNGALELSGDNDHSVYFDGVSQYASVPDDVAFSIGATGLTVECWINPQTTNMPTQEDTGYVQFLGRGDYAPTPDSLEWLLRMYMDGNTEGRNNMISNYAFNPTGGKGSAADTPITYDVIPGVWLHIVGVYTPCTPSTLTASRAANGSTNIPVADTSLFPSSGLVIIATSNSDAVSYAYTGKSTSSGPGNLIGVSIDNNANSFTGTHASGTHVWRADQGHRLYINGQLIESVDFLPYWHHSSARYGTYAVIPGHQPLPLRIAHLTDSFFQGRFDEVAIYPRELTAAEIAATYSEAVTSDPTKPPLVLVPDTFAARLYDDLSPLAYQDGLWGWSLLKFCNSLGTMFQIVEDLVRDTAAGPGWSALVDLDRCPDIALPWLGQLAGVRMLPNSTPDQMRARIASTDGWKRGTRDALVGAAKATLVDPGVVIFRERDHDPADTPDYAYYLTVRTYTAQTPDPTATLAALMAQKPGGIILDYAAAAGQDWQQVKDGYATWADVKAHYPTWAAVALDEP